MRVVCACGKEFRTIDTLTGRSSIRCHLCGRLIDLVPIRRELAAEAESEAERQRRKKIARAEEVGYAGLRFDGVYRTSSPIRLGEQCGGAMHLGFQFRRDLTVEYECSELLDENGAEDEVEEDSGTTDYQVIEDSKIRFGFDAGNWETECEGTPCAEQMRLTYCMEFYFGEGSGGPKCVVEGEATLVFAPSASST